MYLTVVDLRKKNLKTLLKLDLKFEKPLFINKSLA